MDKIDPIENIPSVADRVVDQESSKILHVKAEVFFLDRRSRYGSYEGCNVNFVNPVPVKDGSDRLIGAAALSVENSIVFADIYLDYSTPERLDIENGSKRLYPILVSTELSFINPLGDWATSDLNIKGIVISEEPAEDIRVGALSC